MLPSMSIPNQGSNDRPNEPYDTYMEVRPRYADSQSSNSSKFSQWEWNFKNIGFFILSVLVLGFAMAGLFTEKLSRDQALGICGVVLSSNMPSPLLDLGNKPKKKYYINQMPHNPV